MRFNPFESQLEKLARTLTDSFGVTVLCQGENAYTDGRQIVLPSLPDPMDEPLERMIVGFLDHEMAHVAFTDFDEVVQFNRRYPSCEAMLNVVEDALIEQLAMQRWPGVRRNLDALFKQIKGRVRSALRKASPFRRFCTAVYLKLSHHRDMLGLTKEIVGYEGLLDQFQHVRTTRESAELSEKLLQRWIQRWRQQQPDPGSEDRPPPATGSRAPTTPPIGHPGLATICLEGGSSSRSDSESDDAADEADDTPYSNPGNGDQSTQPSSPNAERDESTDGDGDGSPDSESPHPDGSADDEDTSADDECGADDDGKADVAAPESDTIRASTDDEVKSEPSIVEPPDAPKAPMSRAIGDEANDGGFDFDPSEAARFGDGAGGMTLIIEVVTAGIERAISKVTGDRHYRVFTTQHDRIEVVATANELDVDALLARGEDEVRRLRRGLANALRSAERRWWRDEQPRGSLSPKTLHRLCVDRPRLDVFRTRAQVQGKSTAVSMVLDASGSMTTTKMDVARDAVRVIVQALGDLKIASEVITFTTGDVGDVSIAISQTGLSVRKIKNRYSRISNLEIGLVKRFEDPVKVALNRLPSVQGTGLTPLGEAMQIGARRLVVRPESRKILLVLTDGRPGCEGSDSACYQHACQAAERITDAGIELIGFGVIDDSLQSIVSNTIIVNKIEDLPAQLCKLLGRTLTKGICHAG